MSELWKESVITLSMYLIRLDGKLSVLLYLSGKILDFLVVFRIFGTWIHYQAPSEGELSIG